MGRRRSAAPAENEEKRHRTEDSNVLFANVRADHIAILTASNQRIQLLSVPFDIKPTAKRYANGPEQPRLRDGVWVNHQDNTRPGQRRT